MPIKRATRVLQRVPVRWRLASVSATMTLLILLAFAIFVGQLTAGKMRQDFAVRLDVAAANLQDQLRVRQRFGGGVSISGPDLDDYAAADHAVIRVVDSDGTVLGSTRNAPSLGLPTAGAKIVNGFKVVSRPIAAQLGNPAAWVQYARRPSEVEATIDRMWLFLALGVFGGALLALLSGWALAKRAMSPIAGLTQAAREIGITRDPSRRLPVTGAEDEVADLARTLEQMLASLDQARSETEKVLETQREFVADASHELRTPLTSVLANLELLQRELERSDELGEMVDSAIRSSKRMRTLVSDLLLLARADAGRQSARATVDLTKIVEAVVAEAGPIAGGREIKLALPAEEVFVESNPDELHRMAMNLVENALKHTAAGTPVEVAVESAQNSAKLAVEDHGPGISDQIKPRVFDRFVTLPEGLSEGTGLGLAIVKAVATSHGGDVELTDSEKGGACFTVTLPSASKPEVTRDRP